MPLPEHFRGYLDHGAPLTLVECNKCSNIPPACEEDTELRPVICLTCTTRNCPTGTWYICCCCQQKFPRFAKARSHCESAKHRKNLLAAESNASLPAPTYPAATQVAFLPPRDDLILEHISTSFHPVSESQESYFTLPSYENDIQQETVLASSGTKSNEDQDEDDDDDEIPRPLNAGHEWLADFLKDTPKATYKEVQQFFRYDDNMRYFWLNEYRKHGDGLVFNIARAFQRTIFLNPSSKPKLREAKWHLMNFMQYVSMNEQQQRMHAEITMQIASDKPKRSNGLIQMTRMPDAHELKRFYKSDKNYSLWATLPIPTIQNIDGIAYANPLAICRFAFAFGHFFDDIGVTNDMDTGNTTGKQYHVADSRCIKRCMRLLQEAQNENGSYRIVVSWAVDWRDGFSANRTKNNRKSIVAWTWSLSPTKSKVNSGDNTFAMALGQKKNSSWHKVEHLVKKDTACMADPKKPIMMYHGVLRKMVPVYVVRINSSFDKPERAEITGTIGYTSNVHRCFGKLIDIRTPSYDSTRIKDYLSQERPKENNGLEWGWSDTMLDPNQGAVPNGGILPSCARCRAKRLQGILGHSLFPLMPNENQSNDHPQVNGNSSDDCSVCADWTMDASTAHLLAFPLPDKYPDTCAPNCPVDPPAGRCVTQNPLTLMDLTFEDMVKATKFAFFNATTQVTASRWGKGKFKAYLTSCGIGPKYQNTIWDLAEAVVREHRQHEVNYDDPDRIDGFEFPAAWTNPHLKMRDYIETLMHQICLGGAQSNIDLCAAWNKARKRDTAFKRNAQRLLLELKKFGLNWLSTYHFNTSSDDPGISNTFSTGSWVSENWLAWIRISKIVYLHCCQKVKPSDDLVGYGDVLRLVISFVALAARALSHSGVDESDIQEFNEYIKEFLSCIKELDVQIRHHLLTLQKKPPVTENAGNEGGIESHSAEELLADATSSKSTGNTGNTEEGAPINNGRPSKTKGAYRQKKENARPAKRKRKQFSADDSDYEEEETAPTKTKTKNQSRKKSKKKKAEKKDKSEVGAGEAYWLKSNYMSLQNLVRFLEEFGPLINFWDGGGKCEKFIQKVKPLITRGVHEYDTFFVVIMEKLYKFQVLDLLREMYNLFPKDVSANDEEDRPRFFVGPDGELLEEIGATPNDSQQNVAGMEYSPVEDQHMSKAKAFYVYRNKNQLDTALADNKPISGILIHEEFPSDDPTKLQFYAVYRAEKKSFGWCKMTFDDANGVSNGGLWYAPMNKEAPSTSISSQKFSDIQQLAKMSTVAIPMRYGTGADNLPDSNKYCVITNWWKERQSNGRYTMPGLDPALYVRTDNYDFLQEAMENPNVI